MTSVMSPRGRTSHAVGRTLPCGAVWWGDIVSERLRRQVRPHKEANVSIFADMHRLCPGVTRERELAVVANLALALVACALPL